ncbi:ribosome maturation protein SDO1 [Nematocida sp. AWRm77]|nr:ribosome maturation protein SDO1 [Nematocida sp. AWRm77]
MVFTPENRKKLDNVTVVQYKGKNKTYEIIAIPNKLYEYKRKKDMPLDAVLHTQSIFTDASRGKLAKTEDVKKDFGGTYEKALRCILEQGSEQKDKATREYEQSNTKKLIVEGVCRRLRSKNNVPLTAVQVEDLLRSILYIQTNKPPKVQVNLIIKQLLPLGYMRRTIRMQVEGSIDLQEVLSALPQGSFCRVTENTIEATDDLYGSIHRLAEEQKVAITDIDT